MLIQMGYSVGQADGRFGAKTLRSVLAFQSAHELPVDGVVAANTWMALERHGGRLEAPEEERPAPLPLPEIPEDTVPPAPPMEQAAPPEEVHTRPHTPIPIVPLVEWEPMQTPKIERVCEPSPKPEPKPEEPVAEPEPAPSCSAPEAPEESPVPETPPEPAGQWTPVVPEVTPPEMVAAVEAIAAVVADTGPPQNPWQKMPEVP